MITQRLVVLIKETEWYKLYKHDLDLSKLISRVQAHMKKHPTLFFHEVGNGVHNTWTFECEEIYNWVNSFHEVRPLTSTQFVSELDNCFTIWETKEGSSLAPHVDSARNSGFVIVPLIGNTKTRMHGPLPDDIDTSRNLAVFNKDLETLDHVTYSPGNMIAINNTKYIHSVTPLEPYYRLALQFNARKF